MFIIHNKDFTDKDIAKKDLVGYGVSLIERGGGACKRVDRRAPPPLTIRTVVPVPMATLD